MWAMPSAHLASCSSEALATRFSSSVITASSFWAVEGQDFSSKSLKVSLLSPGIGAPFSPFILASDSAFQKSRWLVIMPTEWSAGAGLAAPPSDLGIHLACSGVRLATAMLMGTNHSSLLWVERSWARRTERRVGGAAGGFGVWAASVEAKRRMRSGRMGVILGPGAERWQKR